MRRAARLLELQKIDLALDAARKRAQAIETLLTESSALRAARLAAERVRDRLTQLRTRSKDLELQSETLDNKIKTVEERLYSGVVKNHKELSDLQRDGAALRRHKGELDDTLLGVMEGVEQAELEYDEVQAELARVEAAWQTDQAALVVERSHLLEQIEGLTSEQSARRAARAPADLALYDRLRAQRHGHAVARLDEGMCGACGVEPSASKLAHLQRDDELLTCGNCERILVID
ncbi:MAG TPA: hypothetical protein VJG32_20115 [Anaerolineae bacterium]|nr:hypothetical protein [Anaerolineae bacterium]